MLLLTSHHTAFNNEKNPTYTVRSAVKDPKMLIRSINVHARFWFDLNFPWTVYFTF